MLQACRGLVLGSIVLGLIGCAEDECKNEGLELSETLNCDAGDCCAVINPIRSDLVEFSGKCFEFVRFPEVASAEVQKQTADSTCQATCVAEAVRLTALAQCDANNPQTCCDAVAAAEDEKTLHDAKCSFYANVIVYNDELTKLNDAFTAAVSSCDALSQAEVLCKDLGSNLSSNLACSASQCCEVYNPLRSAASNFLTTCENYTSLFEVGNATQDVANANAACEDFCIQDLQTLTANLACDDKAPQTCCDSRDAADTAIVTHELSCSFYSTVAAYQTEETNYAFAYDFADQNCPASMMI